MEDGCPVRYKATVTEWSPTTCQGTLMVDGFDDEVFPIVPGLFRITHSPDADHRLWVTMAEDQFGRLLPKTLMVREEPTRSTRKIDRTETHSVGTRASTLDTSTDSRWRSRSPRRLSRTRDSSQHSSVTRREQARGRDDQQIRRLSKKDIKRLKKSKKERWSPTPPSEPRSKPKRYDTSPDRQLVQQPARDRVRIPRAPVPEQDLTESKDSFLVRLLFHVVSDAGLPDVGRIPGRKCVTQAVEKCNELSSSTSLRLEDVPAIVANDFSGMKLHREIASDPEFGPKSMISSLKTLEMDWDRSRSSHSLRDGNSRMRQMPPLAPVQSESYLKLGDVLKGTIRTFDVTKGYGFMDTKTSRVKSIFFHLHDLIDRSWDSCIKKYDYYEPTLSFTVGRSRGNRDNRRPDDLRAIYIQITDTKKHYAPEDHTPARVTRDSTPPRKLIDSSPIFRNLGTKEPTMAQPVLTQADKDEFIRISALMTQVTATSIG
jgi:hypothetical protein